MNPWIALVLGLILGWFFELLIDIFYWRKRRLCPDDTVLAVRAEMEKVEAENKRLQVEINGRKSQIDTLEAQLAGWRGELDLLNEESKGYGFGSIFPNGQLKLAGFIDGIKDRFAQFRADLDAKDATIGDLNLNLNSKDAELGRVNADLDGVNVELGNAKAELGDVKAELGSVKAELDTFDKEVSRFELGSLFNDGKLAIGGFLGNLRSRFDSDNEAHATISTELDGVRADLNAKDARIGELEAELKGKDVQLGKLQAELDELDSEIDGMGLGKLSAGGGGLAIGGFLANLRNRFGQRDADKEAKAELDLELTNLRTDLDARNVRIGELEAELGSVKAELANCHSLTADLDAKTARIGELEAELNTASAVDMGDYELMRGDLEAKDIRIGDLEAELAAKEAALGNLQAEISQLDDEMDGMGLGRLAGSAGGGLAIGGFLANLRNRFGGGDDEAEVEASGDLEMLQGEIEAKDIRIGDLEAQLDLCNSSLAELRASATEYTGPRGLSMVWGLNTDANDALEAKGIYTYNQLGATQAADVDDALTFAQPYYPEYDNPRIHTSWVEQSNFAANDDWTGLLGYQKQNFNVESLKDDLKKLWGVGPKIERVLNDNGIYLFSQVASVPAERITEILREAGSRFRMSSDKLHESWPKQARLAERGEWDEMKRLTDKLSWSNVN